MKKKNTIVTIIVLGMLVIGVKYYYNQQQKNIKMKSDYTDEVSHLTNEGEALKQFREHIKYIRQTPEVQIYNLVDKNDKQYDVNWLVQYEKIFSQKPNLTREDASNMLHTLQKKMSKEGQKYLNTKILYGGSDSLKGFKKIWKLEWQTNPLTGGYVNAYLDETTGKLLLISEHSGRI